MSKIKNFKLYIPYLDEMRRIQVYLPKNYDENKTFPVIYFHDGQNIFDATNSFSGYSWKIQHCLDTFYTDYKKGVIAVAIDNSEVNRMNEYSPWTANNFNKFMPHWDIQVIGGLGDKYNDWFVNTLVPYINRNYRTNNKNTIIGSSMGGFISLYIGYKNPDLFQAIGSLSTAIWFNKLELFNFLDKNINLNSILYFDIGTNETSSNLESFPQIYLNDTLELENIVKKHQVKTYMCLIDKGAIHSEVEWAKRMPKIIDWLNINNAL